MKLVSRAVGWVMCLGGASVAAADSPSIVEVEAEFETPTVCDNADGDFGDADDPAIWVHPREDDREDSLVLGTLKNAGLAVYNLEGELVQRISAPPAPSDEDAPGRFNNVEVLYNFPVRGAWGRHVDIAVVSDRGRDQLRIYAIDPDEEDSPLVDITAPDVPFVFSADQEEVNGERTAYGLAAVSVVDNGPALVFVSRNGTTTVARLQLVPTRDGHVGYRELDRFDLPEVFRLQDGSEWQACAEEDGQSPQIEGMVVDRRRGLLYLAQEQIGIWSTSIWEPQARLRQVDVTAEFGVPYTRTWDPSEEEYECEIHYAQNPDAARRHLRSDVEGLTLYEGPGDRGYLIAASQGGDAYVLYDRSGDNQFVGTFIVVGNGEVDAAQETDGLAVVSANLGDEFEQGLLVVHDGDDESSVACLDEDGEPADRTNFKLVPWRQVAEAFEAQ
jgi:3-phytase